MSKGNQDFGFDPDDQVVLGKTIRVQFDIAGLLASGVTSIEWSLFDLIPEEQTGQTAQVTKTAGSGIVLTDGASGLEVLITMDPADTAALPGGDYFHRLDYVASGGDQFEAARGQARLTPRT